MPDELTERIIKVIARSTKILAEKVTIESGFDELGIDSVDALGLIFELEDEFDVNIPDDQLRMLLTVRQAVEGVQGLMAAKTSAAAAAAE